MQVTERVLRFERDGDALLGIAHVPEVPSDIGVVVIVGGPQYRVGSHRQFVHLARGLAAAGFTTLRFDAAGTGDSAGSFEGFEHLSADVRAAIDALQREIPAVRRVVLWGLCDGASAALLYLDDTGDQRVQGVCLANPWVRDATSLARMQVKHYFGQRLAQPAFWMKLLRGEVGTAALKGWWQAHRLARAPTARAIRGAQTPYQVRMARAWSAFTGSSLLLLSGNDYTAKEFVMRMSTEGAAWPTDRMAPVHLPDEDHTFSSLEGKRRVLEEVLTWCRSLEGMRRRGAAVTPLTFAFATFALAVGLVMAALPAGRAVASESTCGALQNAYGPFDYRTQQHMLEIVDKHHFTPQVEALLRGVSGTIEMELDYILRASPNHHRALSALTRLVVKRRSPQPGNLPRPAECYFERALRFQPTDLVARMLYAQFLTVQRRPADALRELDLVVATAGDSELTHYNAGLLYAGLHSYDKALLQAHRAMELGHPATELQAELKARGVWRDPETRPQRDSVERVNPAASAASAS